MKIKETTTYNAGGHVMVDYHEVENGGELKLIGVSDECIVGYSTNEPWSEEDTALWVMYHETPNTSYLPDEILDTLKARCTVRWPIGSTITEEPCGYCGIANDPNVICSKCYSM